MCNSFNSIYTSWCSKRLFLIQYPFLTIVMHLLTATNIHYIGESRTTATSNIVLVVNGTSLWYCKKGFMKTFSAFITPC